MSHVKKLELLLKEDVLLEVNAEVEALKVQLQKKQKKELQEELEYMQAVKLYFDEVIMDIDHNNLSEEDALEILENLEEMRVEDEV
ncbi:MAG: hypothetical protein ACNI3C_11585 [Candidatus Marinarcus sp.]|uniref:hypothetical protein n=1 Tax=Candidatus Marinarcus sp. TaxID=3100987 RepID=UPI003AFF8745